MDRMAEDVRRVFREARRDVGRGGDWRDLALRELIMRLSGEVVEGRAGAMEAFALVVAVARHEHRPMDAAAEELAHLSGETLAGAVIDVAQRTVDALERSSRLDGRDHRQCVGGSGPCRAVHTARAAVTVMRQDLMGLAQVHDALRAVRAAVAAGAGADQETRVLRLLKGRQR